MRQLKTMLCLIAVVELAFAPMSFGTSAQTEALQERIKPVGQVCMKGEACADAQAAAGGAESGVRSGEEIYTSKCLACHATGAAGAPKVGSIDDWLPRTSKGQDTLYANAINGLNAMPAKGLCMDCTDDEIKDSVDYMVENSQ